MERRGGIPGLRMFLRRPFHCLLKMYLDPPEISPVIFRLALSGGPDLLLDEADNGVVFLPVHRITP